MPWKIRRANSQMIREKITPGKQADCLGCLMRRVRKKEKKEEEDAPHQVERERDAFVWQGRKKERKKDGGWKKYLKMTDGL